MVWSLRSGPRGALLVAGLALAAGCGDEVEHFPPPQPYDPGVTGGAAGGGAGGSTASSGGGGTASTTGTTGPDNTCECAYAFTFDDACGSCVNDSANGACKPALLNCQIDGACAGLVNCPSFCSLKPKAEQIACIQACYVPFPDDAAHQLFATYITCVCGACASKCTPAEPITCE